MQKEHHAVVVKHYSESEGAYADLPDDGYVYQKLLGHISAAGMISITLVILPVCSRMMHISVLRYTYMYNVHVHHSDTYMYRFSSIILNHNGLHNRFGELQ